MTTQMMCLLQSSTNGSSAVKENLGLAYRFLKQTTNEANTNEEIGGLIPSLSGKIIVYFPNIKIKKKCAVLAWNIGQLCSCGSLSLTDMLDSSFGAMF